MSREAAKREYILGPDINRRVNAVNINPTSHVVFEGTPLTRGKFIYFSEMSREAAKREYILGPDINRRVNAVNINPTSHVVFEGTPLTRGGFESPPYFFLYLRYR